MTPIETLKRLAELQKDATNGPWNTDLEMEAGECDWKVQINPVGRIAVAYTWGCNRPEVKANAALIAQSGSTDFAALADYVEGLRAAVRDLSGYGDDPCAMPDELKIKHAATIAECGE